MVYNLCKKYGFLSINSTKNGCFVSRNKKDIILSAFLEEKRDSSLLRPQRLLRLQRPLRLKMLLRSKNHLLHLFKAFFIFFEVKETIQIIEVTEVIMADEVSEVIRITQVLKFQNQMTYVMQFDDLKKIKSWIGFWKISS